jgi:Domain of unknown function (DUF6468)
VTYSFGFMIESLVAILLLITIAYCIVLNNRLKRLKADEQALKATIAELITATEIAERAVAGLKTTAHECDRTLGERLRGAERCRADLIRQVKSGDLLIKQLSRIVAAAQPVEVAPEQALGVKLEPKPEFEPESESELDAEAVAGLDNESVSAPIPAPTSVLASAPPAQPVAAPDPRAVAAAAQAFAQRARSRLSALAA